MAKYKEKFKEFKRWIQIVKEEVVTLNRFKKGLNSNLLGEIITRGVTTLGEAYDLAKNCELATKSIFGDVLSSEVFLPTLNLLVANLDLPYPLRSTPIAPQ